MIPSTYWLARKISSSSFSRLQVVDQACTAAPSAMAATASVTMKTIRMAPDSLFERAATVRAPLLGNVERECHRPALEGPTLRARDDLGRAALPSILAGAALDRTRGVGCQL